MVVVIILLLDVSDVDNNKLGFLRDGGSWRFIYHLPTPLSLSDYSGFQTCNIW